MKRLDDRLKRCSLRTSQECQIDTALPGGGGDNGGRGGNSVGVAAGVPVPWVNIAVGKMVPPGVIPGVEEITGVGVARGVEVPGPG